MIDNRLNANRWEVQTTFGTRGFISYSYITTRTFHIHPFISSPSHDMAHVLLSSKIRKVVEDTR